MSQHTTTAPAHDTTRRAAVATFCIVSGGSILFCSKGVFAKIAYGYGVDPITVLTLRMLIALPFFATIVLIAARGIPRLPVGDWARLVGLGFLGYYLSSFVNFTGLQYVSVGLERVILFTYPVMVLAITVMVLRQPVRPAAWAASAVAWAGVVCAFSGEAGVPVEGGNVPLGGSLVFVSAIIYAVFIVISGGTIARVGPMLFAGAAVGFSCLFMLLHYALANPLADLLYHPLPVYGCGLVLAVLGTAAPAVLMSIGLKRAGPQRFAVMGAIGPVATLFLAWAMLGEQPTALQALGLALAITGGITMASLGQGERARVGSRAG